MGKLRRRVAVLAVTCRLWEVAHLQAWALTRCLRVQVLPDQQVEATSILDLAVRTLLVLATIKKTSSTPPTIHTPRANLLHLPAPSPPITPLNPQTLQPLQQISPRKRSQKRRRLKIPMIQKMTMMKTIATTATLMTTHLIAKTARKRQRETNVRRDLERLQQPIVKSLAPSKPSLPRRLLSNLPLKLLKPKLSLQLIL